MMTPVALEWWLRPARSAARGGEQERRCVELCKMQTARCRASTPDQLARLEKRKEERGIHVPEAKLASGRLVRIPLAKRKLTVISVISHTETRACITAIGHRCSCC